MGDTLDYSRVGPNQQLAARQIANHGRDRYPSVQSQLIKLVEEIGELAKEINKNGSHSRIRDEMADCGLALYNLANKCHVDLDKAMHNIVDHDDRKFA